MQRILGIALLIVALAACGNVPLAVLGMNTQQIQAVSDFELCHASNTLAETRGQRYPTIENEISRRGLSCGSKDVQVADAAGVAPNQVMATAPEGAETRALRNVNMRAGPGTSHPIVGLLRSGEPITVLSAAGSWCECMTSGGQRVYVSCNFLAVPSGGWPTSRLAASSSTPTFSVGVPYPDVRRRLLNEGWNPYPLQFPGSGCGEGDERCAGFLETTSCSGIGRAVCIYTWRRGDQYLIIHAAGEMAGQEFDAIRECGNLVVDPSNPSDWRAWCRPPTASLAQSAVIRTPTQLRHGAYVHNEVSCGQASNATLAYFDGRFHINQIGWLNAVPVRNQAGSYTAHIDRVRDESVSFTIRLTVLNDREFTTQSDDGQPARYRYCTQASLPAIWRGHPDALQERADRERRAAAPRLPTRSVGADQVQLTAIEDPFSGAACRLRINRGENAIVGGSDYFEDSGTWHIGINGRDHRLSEIRGSSFDLVSADRRISVQIRRLARVWQSQEPTYPAEEHRVTVSINLDGVTSVLNAYLLCGDG